MLIHSLRLTRETPAVTVQFHNIHSMKQGNNAKLIFTGSKFLYPSSTKKKQYTSHSIHNDFHFIISFYSNQIRSLNS